MRPGPDALLRRDQILTVPNLLTLLRLVLFVPVFVLVHRGGGHANLQAFFLMVLMVLTDCLDGYIARRYRQKSELGRVLDPLVDKICIGGMFFLLAWQRELPWWLVLVVLGRDLLILVAGLLILGRHRHVAESTPVGKAAVAILAATLFVFLFDLKPLKQVAIVFSLAAVLVSGVAYAARFYRIMRGYEPVPAVHNVVLAGDGDGQRATAS